MSRAKNIGAGIIGPLSTIELNNASKTLIKIAQDHLFAAESRCLSKGQPIQFDSCLKTLNPFLDNGGIIRVGGRLRNSYHEFNEKHPIILPRKHPLTRLLIEHAHRSELHAGAQATLAKIRTKYWSLEGRSSVRHVIGSCVTCAKAKPIMWPTNNGRSANGACQRQPARPFINVGVDYCGPFTIRNGPTRRASKSKIYVAIFVCMALKAVHSELVSGLDSNSFISALKRFCIPKRNGVQHLF